MNKELREVTAKRDEYLAKWIDDHKRTLSSAHRANPRDVLDEMLIAQEESGMTDDDILVKAAAFMLAFTCAFMLTSTCACSSVLLLTRSRSLQIILWDVMAGGIDTSATSIEWLIYILINHPEVQTKAQEELLRVVGPNRLPTFDDAENLPYLNAVISECFRFKHFAPFGIPHSTTKDTTLGGYRVPKAAQVMINIYALHMDPENWKDPEEFRPERFLEEEKGLAGFFLNPQSHNGKHGLGEKAYKFLPYGAGIASARYTSSLHELAYYSISPLRLQASACALAPVSGAWSCSARLPPTSTASTSLLLTAVRWTWTRNR
jgi:cytochrome P450